ncbi:uncharacterized protein LAESUDRAFT_131454 [Laetiporus sulphureus 93-53]|uniref:Uncharacterized protein n=1 Tax=Laetiporus sulphureus 93-53 TaxID=1314785 RepID=A0A165EHQ3_9APHY|nr:uncharacterized protein LAESUDRAFT_131454 [Laetiporus sulphureus 93-53]KZT07072.1 hypothetical protein LAESUDRAFT_131454 [Laetiporus sulphureus 93-53]
MFGRFALQANHYLHPRRKLTSVQYRRYNRLTFIYPLSPQRLKIRYRRRGSLDHPDPMKPLYDCNHCCRCRSLRRKTVMRRLEISVDEKGKTTNAHIFKEVAEYTWVQTASIPGVAVKRLNDAPISTDECERGRRHCTFNQLLQEQDPPLWPRRRRRFV